MRQPKINKKRADRAELTLKAGDYWDHGESYAASDLICDLRHLCDREGWDFTALLDSAEMHYSSERAPDDLELDRRRDFKRNGFPVNDLIARRVEAARG